jgi:urease accessory protein
MPSRLRFCHQGDKTVSATAFATSPLRFLLPRNHGNAVWAYLVNFGGGLVDGDRVEVEVEAEAGTCAFIATQASTKVYRSPAGCSQRFDLRIGDGAALAMVSDPVVCFAGARYDQDVRISLADDGSVFIVEGYTCGRRARGERWQFDRYASRTIIRRGGRPVLVDSTRLDPADGSIAERMGQFDALITAVAVGPRFAAVREAMLATGVDGREHTVVAAPSAVSDDAVILRVAAQSFETASRVLRSSFDALTPTLGDDPFARRW